jgi:hypothetical protein
MTPHFSRTPSMTRITLAFLALSILAGCSTEQESARGSLRPGEHPAPAHPPESEELSPASQPDDAR